MKRYVERDAAGRIIGAYAAPQPGRAEEEKADDDPEVVAFENPPEFTDAERAEAEIVVNPALRGLVRALAKRLGATPAKLIAEIKAEVDR